MEILFVLAGIAICIVICASKNKGENASIAPHNSAASLPLQLRCRFENKHIPGIENPLKMLTFEVKNLAIEGNGNPLHMQLRMVDDTDGTERSILCGLEELQAPNSLSFLAEEELPHVPYGMIMSIDTFKSVFSVPKELLLFPWSGQRNITASIEFRRSGWVLQKAKTSFKVNSSTEGYIEGVANRERAEEMGIYLAMHLAAADGNIDKQEADVVKDWVKLILSEVASDDHDRRRDRLNEVISDAFQKAKTTSLDLDYITGELEEKASMPIKYELIELCMDVMKADGVADPSEMRELKRVANMIGLEEGRYSALLDKRLADVETIDVSNTESLASILGITSSMSKEEIRKHLTKEYRKWKSRVSHDDEEIRNRATKMIEHIAEARKQYL